MKLPVTSSVKTMRDLGLAVSLQCPKFVLSMWNGHVFDWADLLVPPFPGILSGGR